MRNLVFQDVGREKWSGVIQIQDNISPKEIAECAYREVVKHLVSRFPDTEYDADTNTGVITAGYRVVGHFHIDGKIFPSRPLDKSAQ